MSALKSFRFPSKDSYRVIASKGKKVELALLNLKILSAQCGNSKFCFVIKKKNGCAVFRNRCRRILREVFFSEAKNFKNPLWVMITVKMSENDANWNAFRECAREATDNVLKEY